MKKIIKSILVMFIPIILIAGWAWFRSYVHNLLYINSFYYLLSTFVKEIWKIISNVPIIIFIALIIIIRNNWERIILYLPAIKKIEALGVTAETDFMMLLKGEERGEAVKDKEIKGEDNVYLGVLHYVDDFYLKYLLDVHEREFSTVFEQVQILITHMKDSKFFDEADEQTKTSIAIGYMGALTKLLEEIFILNIEFQVRDGEIWRYRIRLEEDAMERVLFILKQENKSKRK